MKITINIPDKHSLKDIDIVRCEPNPKGLKSDLEKKWRKYLKRNSNPLNIPIQCEYCSYVGSPQYHCYNSESSKYGINVVPFNVCRKWEPNMGLILYLSSRAFRIFFNLKEEK